MTMSAAAPALARSCSRRNDIPCGPINDYAQVFADPQVARARWCVETDHPALGRLRTLGSPIKMSATPADATPARAAARRAHRRSAEELGLAGDEIEALRRAGTIQ